MSAQFKKMAIIGLGLIGSSLARAARENNLATSIIGIDNNEVALGYAKKHGFVDSVFTDASQAVRGCDVVVICTPIQILPEICQSISSALADNALVMDCGSVKRWPLAVMNELLEPRVRIVPAHPIAGSEQSGIAAGRADMFVKKRVIITPEEPLSHADLQMVDSFWRKLGARVEAMPADLHDYIYAYVSHLPQIIAFAAGEIISPDEIMLKRYPELQKFLRLSNSNKELWRGIFSLNQEILANALNRYLAAIAHIEHELSSAPESNLENNNEQIESSNKNNNSSSNYPKEMLFARITSSCLATTIMEAEKKQGLSFVRFSGSGFADVIAPASESPENDLERISENYAKIIPLLSSFKELLDKFLKSKFQDI